MIKKRLLSAASRKPVFSPNPYMSLAFPSQRHRLVFLPSLAMVPMDSSWLELLCWKWQTTSSMKLFHRWKIRQLRVRRDHRHHLKDLHHQSKTLLLMVGRYCRIHQWKIRQLRMRRDHRHLKDLHHRSKTLLLVMGRHCRGCYHYNWNRSHHLLD